MIARPGNIRMLTALALTGVLCAPGVWAQIMTAPDPPDVRILQKLDSQVPLDLSFRDEEGNSVRLDSLIKDKPVVLSLVYYECPMLCSVVMEGMLDCFNDLEFTLGDEYTVITVSFDPDETAELASKKKQTYMAHYKTPGAGAGWHFLTGDPDEITALAQAVGFQYEYLPSTDEFAHAAGIMVLTPKGKVARYFYGINYPPRDVKFGLMDASEERIGSIVSELILLCYHYDPATGTYGNVIFKFLRLGGVATVLAIVLLVGYLIRSERKKGQSSTGAPGNGSGTLSGLQP